MPKITEEYVHMMEMGVSLIIEAIIENKKALIGHNCMYDWVYVYNQFIGVLPDTYEEFIKAWSVCFPQTFDNKRLWYNTMLKEKSYSLGALFTRCQADKNFQQALLVDFDLEKNFVNYHGDNALNHYHEAAYDAHMTGYVFAHLLMAK